MGLMQVCFTIGGGLKHFFRTRYHIFPNCHTRYHSCYILLWELCNVSNGLLILGHYYISYCMRYYTFSVKYVHICMIFSPLSRITIMFFFRKRSLLIFKKKKKKLRVKYGNALENWQLRTYLTENVFDDIQQYFW